MFGIISGKLNIPGAVYDFFAVSNFWSHDMHETIRNMSPPFSVELCRGRDSAGTRSRPPGPGRRPRLYRGRGLKFLFYTPEDENFSASKILKNIKI